VTTRATDTPISLQYFFKIAENEQWRTHEARIVYIVAKKKQFVAIAAETLHDKFNATQLPAYKRADE
jgi:hypothetical protein